MGEACTPPEQSLGRLPNTLMFGKAESWEAIPGGKTEVQRNNRMECPGARTSTLQGGAGPRGSPTPLSLPRAPWAFAPQEQPPSFLLQHLEIVPDTAEGTSQALG